MKLKSVRIRNIRSYKNLKEMTFDKKITILVGKNESGKTNCLKALESLNPDYKYSRDDLCYYSDEINKKQAEIEMINAFFQLDEEDRKKFNKINPYLSKIGIVSITKYYDNHYELKIEEPSIKVSDIQVKELEGKLKKTIDDLRLKMEMHYHRSSLFAGNKDQFESISNKLLKADLQPTTLIETLNSFYKDLKRLPNQDGPIQTDIRSIINQLERIKTEILRKETDIEKQILTTLPYFIYFNTIDLLEDKVNIENYLTDMSKYKTFRHLTEISGLKVEEVAKGEVFERRYATEEASTTITGMMNESWTQEKINVRIGVDAKDLYVYVLDESGGRDPPSKRSEGFQWFLSFYINFIAGSKGEYRNTIMLLDNPGIFLHPSGQKDMLNTLEKIAENNQIVFTTHSPFLINRKYLSRVRIILKGGYKEGTNIIEKFHASNFDSLEPIRAAIGMTLGDILFGSKNNLIVEGYSDCLIIEGMSYYCKKRNKKHLLDNISIITVGSADKVPYFTLLLAKENLPYVILLDGDPKGRKIKKELVEDFSIADDIIKTIDNIAPDEMRGIDLEIEDVIDPSFYNQAVNRAYEKILVDKVITKISLEDLDATIKKQTKKYEEFFKNKRIGEFNKIIVAKEINKMLVVDAIEESVVNQKTIESFTQLFELINEKFS